MCLGFDSFSLENRNIIKECVESGILREDEIFLVEPQYYVKFLDPIIFMNLTNDKLEEHVKRWKSSQIKDFEINPEKCKFIIIPGLSMSHWVLYIVSLINCRRSFLILDSAAETEQVYSTIRTTWIRIWLVNTWKKKGINDVSMFGKDNMMDTEIKCAKMMPNSNSCGPFLLGYLENFLMNHESILKGDQLSLVDFTCQDGESYRQRMRNHLMEEHAKRKSGKIASK